jgi:hypothetical protein
VNSGGVTRTKQEKKEGEKGCPAVAAVVSGAAGGDKQRSWWFAVMTAALFFFLLSLPSIFHSLLCFFFFSVFPLFCSLFSLLIFLLSSSPLYL